MEAKPSECFNGCPLELQAAGHLSELQAVASSGSQQATAAVQRHMRAQVNANELLSLDRDRCGGGGGGGGSSSDAGRAHKPPTLDLRPPKLGAENVETSVTRVAFATADIRRALARLTRLERCRQQIQGMGQFAGVSPFGCVHHEDVLGSARELSVRRRFKITRGRHRPESYCAINKNDLCPVDSRWGSGRESFYPHEQPIKAKQQRSRRLENHSSANRDGRRHYGQENSCSGSVSMNHLNEITTSAVAICCPSLRARSYGVSDILTGGAQADEQQSWLTRITLTPSAPGCKKIQTSPSNGDKYTVRPDFISFECDKREAAEQDVQIKQSASHNANQIELNKTSSYVQNTFPEANRKVEPMQANEQAQSASSSLSLSGTSGANGNKNFGKLVGKKAGRFKELVLQNLGKANHTQDELFDLHELNFHKQQQQVSKLTKEFKTYLASLKHFHEASRSLNKCIQQSTSDYQSARHDLVCENLAQMDALNEDLVEKLRDDVLKHVGEYSAKFADLKEKISKRHRKLIDYDKSRRLYELMLVQVNKRREKLQQANGGAESQEDSQNYQSILRGLKFLSQQQQQPVPMGSQQEVIASQLVDEARLLKFREQFNYHKLMYETINGELHEELPVFYEKKMKSLLMALQNYFTLEARYQSDAAKLMNTASEVIDEMPHCPSLQQAMAARSLSSGGQQKSEPVNDDAQTVIGIDRMGQSSKFKVEDNDDDNDDEADENSYEYGSSSCSSEGHRGVEVPGDKSCQLVTNAGCSSSGLGSSRGESSCSVGSSSPDCPNNEVSMAPANDDNELDGGSGKVEQPVDCLSGATAVPVVVVVEMPASSNQQRIEPTGETEQTLEGSGLVSSEQTSLPHKVEERESEKFYQVGERSDSNEPLAQISLPSGVLYKVRTNYKYLAEDVDELCFESNEIIQVIEFDENQEPEEGWLLGIREINGQRGLFPANFTQPI